MSDGSPNRVLRQIRAVYSVGTFAGLGDGQLLERFTTRQGEAAELAFATIVERHGPMVYRICRRVLQDAHEAEDAFQATLLVLVRKASGLRDQNSVGHWLSGVAWRVALDARCSATRRKQHETRHAKAIRAELSGEPLEDHETHALVYEELRRLPQRYREPVILFHLEGLSHEEVASRLGRPVGTIRSRLARGRDRLRDRLIRRGIAPAVGAIAAACPASAPAAIPQGLFDLSVVTAVRFASGRAAAAGTVSAAVAALVKEELRSMLMPKIKLVAAILATFGCAATGAGVYAYQDAGNVATAPARSETTQAKTASAEPASPGTAHLTKLPSRGAAIGEYLEKTKKEVDAAVNDLRAEVAELRAKLDEAENNLSRLEALQSSLDQKSAANLLKKRKLDLGAKIMDMELDAKLGNPNAKEELLRSKLRGDTLDAAKRNAQNEELLRSKLREDTLQADHQRGQNEELLRSKLRADTVQAEQQRELLDKQIKQLIEARDRLNDSSRRAK